MRILSLTFHCVEERLVEWENYFQSEMVQMTENMMDVEKYILSEVESDMIQEGQNYNLLLVFEDQKSREQFMESELVNVEDRIMSKFGDSVMLFCTLLNPQRSKI